MAIQWSSTDAEGRALYAYTSDPNWEPVKGYPSDEGAWESFLYYHRNVAAGICAAAEVVV